MADSLIAGAGPRYCGVTPLRAARIDPADDDARLPAIDLFGETASAAGTMRPSRPNPPVELFLRLTDNTVEGQINGGATRAVADRLFRIVISYIDDDEPEPQADPRPDERSDGDDQPPPRAGVEIEEGSEKG